MASRLTRMLFVLLATATPCVVSLPECVLKDLVIIEGLANYDMIQTYRVICNSTGYDIYPFKKPPTDTMIAKVCDNWFCRQALKTFGSAVALPKCILNINGVLETAGQHLKDICAEA